jgi:hypothetical protein
MVYVKAFLAAVPLALRNLIQVDSCQSEAFGLPFPFRCGI